MAVGQKEGPSPNLTGGGWKMLSGSRIDGARPRRRGFWDARMIRILLAEDDESMRLYLARALERVGYHVTAVDRGTAAVPLLES